MTSDLYHIAESLRGRLLIRRRLDAVLTTTELGTFRLQIKKFISRDHVLRLAAENMQTQCSQLKFISLRHICHNDDQLCVHDVSKMLIQTSRQNYSHQNKEVHINVCPEVSFLSLIYIFQSKINLLFI